MPWPRLCQTAEQSLPGASGGATTPRRALARGGWGGDAEPLRARYVFGAVIARLGEYFDLDIFATRLNFYRDGSDWKPFHHDSHAYAKGHGGVKEDFTVGASFGAQRHLAWRHAVDNSSDAQFSFPQANGDVFAFASDVNDRFMHGVPRA